MPRIMLTDAVVTRTTPPSSGRLELRDTLLPGLVVRITDKGHRSFSVHAKVHGRGLPAIRYDIGPVHLYSLKDARQKARDALLLMHQGIDPREQRRARQDQIAAQAETTVKAMVERWLAEPSREKLASAAGSARLMRKHVVPVLGPNRQLSSVEDTEIAALIDRLRKKTPPTALRVTVLIKGFFRWASSPARPPGQRLEVNPAADLFAKDFGLKVEIREVLLPNNLVAAIWHRAGDLEEPWKSYFRLMLLTGQRRHEISALRWSEVDLKAKLITIPAERMKKRKIHAVPLTGRMLEMLTELKERYGSTPYVFGRDLDPSMDRGVKKLKKLVQQDLPDAPRWTIHDFRKVVRTGLGAIPQIPYDVAELVLAHVPDVLARTYNLHLYEHEKRQALELWDARLAEIVGGDHEQAA